MLVRDLKRSVPYGMESWLQKPAHPPLARQTNRVLGKRSLLSTLVEQMDVDDDELYFNNCLNGEE